MIAPVASTQSPGHDAASVKTIGNDLVILRYLYKAERFPVVWHFYYYRPASSGTAPKGDWNLIEIRFEDESVIIEANGQRQELKMGQGKH